MLASLLGKRRKWCAVDARLNRRLASRGCVSRGWHVGDNEGERAVLARSEVVVQPPGAPQLGGVRA
eukprot:6720710-Prymnesium_polylepis.2